MKQVVLYEAKDGTRFNDRELCQNYDTLIDNVEDIISKLKPRDKISYNEIAVKQDIEVVKSAKRKFYLCCATAIPLFEKVFMKVGLGECHTSHAGRILSDYSNDFPILYKTYFRLECISEISGMEYDQPYFAVHEHEFKGEIIN